MCDIILKEIVTLSDPLTAEPVPRLLPGKPFRCALGPEMRGRRVIASLRWLNCRFAELSRCWLGLGACWVLAAFFSALRSQITAKWTHRRQVESCKPGPMRYTLPFSLCPERHSAFSAFLHFPASEPETSVSTLFHALDFCHCGSVGRMDGEDERPLEGLRSKKGTE